VQSSVHFKELNNDFSGTTFHPVESAQAIQAMIQVESDLQLKLAMQ